MQRLSEGRRPSPGKHRVRDLPGRIASPDCDSSADYEKIYKLRNLPGSGRERVRIEEDSFRVPKVSGAIGPQGGKPLGYRATCAPSTARRAYVVLDGGGLRTTAEGAPVMRPAVLAHADQTERDRAALYVAVKTGTIAVDAGPERVGPS